MENDKIKKEYFDIDYFYGNKEYSNYDISCNFSMLADDLVWNKFKLARHNKDVPVLELPPKDELNNYSSLDVGCGPANLVIELRKIGIKAYGIDYNPAIIKHREKDFLMEASATAIPFKDREIDFVYSFQTLFYMESEEQLKLALKEMCRVSKQLVYIPEVSTEYIQTTTDKDKDKMLFMTEEWYDNEMKLNGFIKREKSIYVLEEVKEEVLQEEDKIV